MKTVCDNCEEYDIEIKIHSPEQLRRIIKKVKDALDSNKLSYNSFESDRANIGQVSFIELDINGSFPDVIRYYFDCENCGNVFGLMVETYHGQGGKWSKLGKVSP
ncbi:MAG: hypothetical protein OEQ24_10285 [Gammaproteobacteria bacterium]|nr:hypothetical protein [Gammaproteobacteria bacterium]